MAAKGCERGVRGRRAGLSCVSQQPPPCMLGGRRVARRAWRADPGPAAGLAQGRERGARGRRACCKGEGMMGVGRQTPPAPPPASAAPGTPPPPPAYRSVTTAPIDVTLRPDPQAGARSKGGSSRRAGAALFRATQRREARLPPLSLACGLRAESADSDCAHCRQAHTTLSAARSSAGAAGPGRIPQDAGGRRCARRPPMRDARARRAAAVMRPGLAARDDRPRLPAQAQNHDYCDSCGGKDGALVGCRGCPAAYHKRCMGCGPPGRSLIALFLCWCDSPLLAWGLCRCGAPPSCRHQAASVIPCSLTPLAHPIQISSFEFQSRAHVSLEQAGPWPAVAKARQSRPHK
jgi:hypothetical protein